MQLWSSYIYLCMRKYCNYIRKFNFTARQIVKALLDSHSSLCCFYFLLLVHLVVWPLYLIAELKLHHGSQGRVQQDSPSRSRLTIILVNKLLNC